MTDSEPTQWQWGSGRHLEWPWNICSACNSLMANDGNTVRLLLGPDLVQRATFWLCPACARLLPAPAPRLRVYRAAVWTVISLADSLGLPCTPDGKQTRVPLASWADDTHLLIMAWPPESKKSPLMNPELLLLSHGLPPADRRHEQDFGRSF